ncbi:MAG TPA: efflux RND transporter periplasmic adaptor subunit [Phycisphaerae bacterium]|nr:efflux RND transporter periplasmic adaptor subunit [Phycisphaerae bacterium]
MNLHRALCATICCACLLTGPAASAQWGGPAKVTVANVELRDLPASTTLVGTVEPVTRSTLGAEFGGLVEQMPARQGDFVRAGEILCKLNNDTISLRLAEARERQKGFQATLHKWELEQQRIQRLYGSEDAAEKEVYDTQAAYDLARHTVSEQAAVIARLESDLAKTEIRAPFSGFVITRHTEVGQWLSEGGDVVELADLGTVLVRVDVPEDALPYVRVGARASVMIEALNHRFEGHVRHIILQGDLAARTFPVEIAVPNPGYVEMDGERVPRTVAQPTSAGAPPPTAQNAPGDGGPHGPPPESAPDPAENLLAGGMFARVTLQAGPPAKTPSVPKDAVVTRTGVEYVCMVAPGREQDSLMAMPMPVTTGVDIGDWIAVTSGNLVPGMRIVTQGNENILFPSPVVIVEKLELPNRRSNERSAASPPPPHAKAGS